MIRHVAILGHSATGTTALYDQFLNNRHVYDDDNKEVLSVKRGGKYPHPYNFELLNGIHWYNDHVTHLANNAEEHDKIKVLHIKPEQLYTLGISIEEAVSTLSDRFNFVHTMRHNHLARAVSGVGKQRAQDGLYHMSDKLHMRHRDYIKFIERSIDEDIRIQESIKTYEQYTVDFDVHLCLLGPREVVSRITNKFNFFDDYDYKQKHNSYHATKNKWSDIPLKDKIENFEEITELLTDTPHEWMLQG